MEIKINKDIQDYKTTVYGNLTMRELSFSLLAVIGAVGLFFLTHKAVGNSLACVLCALWAIPCALFGYYEKDHMHLEDRLAVLRRERNTPQVLIFQKENTIFDAMKAKEQEEHRAKIYKHIGYRKHADLSKPKPAESSREYAALQDSRKRSVRGKKRRIF